MKAFYEVELTFSYFQTTFRIQSLTYLQIRKMSSHLQQYHNSKNTWENPVYLEHKYIQKLHIQHQIVQLILVQ